LPGQFLPLSLSLSYVPHQLSVGRRVGACECVSAIYAIGCALGLCPPPTETLSTPSRYIFSCIKPPTTPITRPHGPCIEFATHQDRRQSFNHRTPTLKYRQLSSSSSHKSTGARHRQCTKLPFDRNSSCSHRTAFSVYHCCIWSLPTRLRSTPPSESCRSSSFQRR
jgi:hypothetical protein